VVVVVVLLLLLLLVHFISLSSHLLSLFFARARRGDCSEQRIHFNLGTRPLTYLALKNQLV
jgi:hypothetical protein